MYNSIFPLCNIISTQNYANLPVNFEFSLDHLNIFCLPVFFYTYPEHECKQDIFKIKTEITKGTYKTFF